MTRTKVILIGGCPGAGKTTLGRNLAIRLKITSLTIYDLMIATRAITNTQTHPELHVMSTGDSIAYFTNSSPEKLIEDAQVQHRGTWPAVEKVIRSHAADWGSPIVIDGWAMSPRRVSELGLDRVRSFWLNVDAPVLRERELGNTDFFGASDDQERMYENFMARSMWYNELVEREATQLGLPLLRQDGAQSVERLCEIVMAGLE